MPNHDPRAGPPEPLFNATRPPRVSQGTPDALQTFMAAATTGGRPAKTGNKGLRLWVLGASFTPTTVHASPRFITRTSRCRPPYLILKISSFATRLFPAGASASSQRL